MILNDVEKQIILDNKKLLQNNDFTTFFGRLRSRDMYIRSHIVTFLYENFDFLKYISKIPANLFRNCSITQVSIPANIKNIETCAFTGSQIIRIQFEAPVEKMGESVFSNCTELTQVLLPEGMTEIPARAFSGCSSLKNIYLPESVVKIKANAFERCPEDLRIVTPRRSTNTLSIPQSEVDFYKAHLKSTRE